MIYLLAKFSVIFIIVSLISFFLGRWWARRGIIDVTESYSTFTRLNKLVDDAPWETLLNRIEQCELNTGSNFRQSIAEMPKVDLGFLEENLVKVSQQIRHIPQPDGVDLEPLMAHLNKLEALVEGIEIPPATEPTKLQPALDRILDLENLIRNLPEPVVPEAIDFSPIHQGIEQLNAKVSQIHIPEAQSLEPIEGQIEALQTAIEGISIPDAVDLLPLHEAIKQLQSDLAKIDLPENVDLTPLYQQFEALEKAVDNIPFPEIADLSPVYEKLAKLDSKVSSIELPDPIDLSPIQNHVMLLESAISKIPLPQNTQSIDIDPIHKKLQDIEIAIALIEIPESVSTGDLQLQQPCDNSAVLKELEALKVKLDSIGSATQAKTIEKQAEGPRLLTKAEVVRKEDLKRISGVGTVLENLLNDNGVYCFWQVAEWTAQDIQIMDDRLIFKGRIERDEWVRQAKLFAAEPDSVKAPD